MVADRDLEIDVLKEITRTNGGARVRLTLGTVTESAEELSLSAKTISTYRARVLEKLGVTNSAEIVQ